MFLCSICWCRICPFLSRAGSEGWDWQVHESTLKVTMLGLLLVGFLLSSAFCQSYSGGFFVPPAPKRSELGLRTPEGCLKPKASCNLKCRFVARLLEQHSPVFWKQILIHLLEPLLQAPLSCCSLCDGSSGLVRDTEMLKGLYCAMMVSQVLSGTRA